jgi:soluble lytic murein transglycosylase
MRADGSRQDPVKISTAYHLIIGCTLAFASGLAPAFGGVFSRDAYISQGPKPQQSPESPANSCVSAEECFAAAAFPKEQRGHALSKDQVAALKLERLRKVMEEFPASLWTKRAGLLSGVILIDQNPAAAISHLRAAQQDFPALDDYVRFWIGEALLRLGDPKEAATVFEGLFQAIPDSNLLNQVTFRAGEAWYQASRCPEAITWLIKAADLNSKVSHVAQAQFMLAACYIRENQLNEAREMLKQLWGKFPYAREAKEAEVLLASNIGGEAWVSSPDEHYARAQAFLGQSLHVEAIEELKKFLAGKPSSPHRRDAKLKLGVAQVRLKLYDQARVTFHELAAEEGERADEATVWLARVYLRQGFGEKLLELCRTLHKRKLSPEQKGQINVFGGIWLEDQSRFDEAIVKYRLAAKSGEPASQRAEARWREGWAFYRTARYREAINAWQQIIDQKGSDLEPQALYWIARSYGHVEAAKSQEVVTRLCRQFPHTYYCQLVRDQASVLNPSQTEEANATVSAFAARSVADSVAVSAQDNHARKRADIEQQAAYRRAVELRALGLEQDAVRELSALTDRYGRDPEALAVLSIMLNEVGAYHHALRLVRSRFREKLERTGGEIADGLWSVAYPTGLIHTIQMSAVKGVDPFLVAAIIREESQYDWKAVSRVGAIGLMQVMPATANAVAQQHRLPPVSREDLFDQEMNIRIGVRYVEQLLTQFSGNLVQAIAAYNAGPMVVRNWADTYSGRSEDEFVELIQYQETRQYVKRVLRSYKEYLRLDGRQKTVS